MIEAAPGLYARGGHVHGCENCGAISYGNASCATCRSHWKNVSLWHDRGESVTIEWMLGKPLRTEEILMEAIRHTLNVMETGDVDVVRSESIQAHEAIDRLTASKLEAIERNAYEARHQFERQRRGMTPGGVGPDTAAPR